MSVRKGSSEVVARRRPTSTASRRAQTRSIGMRSRTTGRSMKGLYVGCRRMVAGGRRPTLFPLSDGGRTWRRQQEPLQGRAGPRGPVGFDRPTAIVTEAPPRPEAPLLHQETESLVREVHRPSPAGSGAGPGRGQAAQPQLHRHRAHPPRPHPRGRGGRRPGPGEHGHQPRVGALPGGGDHRPGGPGPQRPHPLHPAGQEGPRALPARGPAAGPQLHRHRAHPPRPHPGGRGRGRPGAPEARGRAAQGPPDGHPAALRLPLRRGPGPGVALRRPAGRRGPGERRLGVLGRRLDGPGPVRAQPHPVRPRAQARPGHRPGAGDRPGHADPVAPHQEQPGAGGRARGGQDRHRRGPGAAHHRR